VTEHDAIRTILLHRPFPFASPFAGQEFAALLLVAASDVTAQEQADLARALVAQGCRYAVCAGNGCSSWDDAIDEAAVIAELQGAPNYGFVMTTWHETEPLEDIASCFLEQALIDDAEPVHHLAVLVGGASAQLEQLESALQSVGGRPTMRCS
jgi:hypothetical protein